MFEETLVIHNPASAGGRAGRQTAALRARLVTRFGDLRFESTRGPRHAECLAREAVATGGVTRILVAGGDGTTSEVVSGLMAESSRVHPVIGLLPFGSGCDLARSLGVPRELEAACDLIEAGAIRRIDAARIEYRDASGMSRRVHCVNEASAGLSGATVRLVGSASKKWGPRLGFMVGAVAAILTHRPSEMIVEIDGERVYEGAVSMVVAANGRYFGAGIEVAPQARIDDGMLEVVLVEGLSIPRLLANLPSLYRGRHLGHPKVSRHSAKRLCVHPKGEAAWVDVDGEDLGRLALSVEIRPAALQVFAPKSGRG